MVEQFRVHKTGGDAADAGVDGMLVVDLPYEESNEIKQYMDGEGLYFVSLVAPTTPALRLNKILKDASGFVYYIMVTGVTGARESVVVDLEEHISALRNATDLPIAVGFGVSSGEQAKVAAEHADAVVVGSALVELMAHGDAGLYQAEALMEEIRSAINISQETK